MIAISSQDFLKLICQWCQKFALAMDFYFLKPFFKKNREHNLEYLEQPIQ